MRDMLPLFLPTRPAMVKLCVNLKAHAILNRGHIGTGEFEERPGEAGRESNIIYVQWSRPAARDPTPTADIHCTYWKFMHFNILMKNLYVSGVTLAHDVLIPRVILLLHVVALRS